MSEDLDSRMLLITTALEETWTLPEGAADTTFLAPWCRRFTRRAVWEPLVGATVDDPWATPERIASGIGRVRELTESALEQLQGVLGAYHGETWSIRETRILLGPWLLSYVPAQLDRWERLALAASENTGLVAWGWPDDKVIVPADTLDAVQLLKSDSYNLQLMTPMMRALGVDLIVATDIVTEPQPPFVGVSGRLSFKRRVAEKFAGAAIAMRAERTIAMRSPHFPRQVQLELVRALRLGALPSPAGPTIPQAAADTSVRAALPVLNMGAGAFERHLVSALIADLPTCFLEGYADLRFGARSMGRYPAAVLSANAWYYEEAFKRWAADGAAAGSQLLGVQHGGNYGIDAYSPSEDHETAITDRYYTWGWTRDGVFAKTMPMPAPKLMRHIDPIPRADATGILLVTTSLPRYPLQVDHDSERFERYLARQDEYLRATSGVARRDLRVRPHRESLGWDVSERIAEAHPDIAIESWDVPFAESLARCRVFVCDHLSTTFAEALAANKPTILFWDLTETRVRPEATEVFRQLADAGILFGDPIAAARATAEAYADAETWWSESGRVNAVARFRERFTCTDVNALGLWVTELKSVLHGS